MIRLLPLITATWRDKIAVGTKFRLIWRICSPKPGITLCAMANVASGVTSRSAGPVPPVVSTRLQSASTNSISAALMPGSSSGIRRSTKVIGLCSALCNHSLSAGKPKSWYTPALARSLTDTNPIRTASGPLSLSLIHLFRGWWVAARIQAHRTNRMPDFHRLSLPPGQRF